MTRTTTARTITRDTCKEAGKKGRNNKITLVMKRRKHKRRKRSKRRGKKNKNKKTHNPKRRKTTGRKKEDD